MTTARPRAQLPDLSEVATRANQMRSPAVFVTASPLREAETKRDKARIQELEAALAAAQAANKATIERAQRESRIEAVTIRVVDRRADWEAKQPKARSPHIIVTPVRMITCETWEPPTLD